LIRIPIIADDTRFAATLAAYEARVRALNAQLAMMGGVVGPGAVVMQPGRRAVVAGVPRGSVQSPARARTPGSASDGALAASMLAAGAAAAAGIHKPFRFSTPTATFGHGAKGEVSRQWLSNIDSVRAKHKHDWKRLTYKYESLKRARRAFVTAESRYEGHKLDRQAIIDRGMRRVARFDATKPRAQVINQDRSVSMEPGWRPDPQRNTMHRLKRRYGVIGRAKSLMRPEGVERFLSKYGTGAVRNYRRINRGLRMIGGGATALGIGSLIPVGAKAQEERERLLHEGKYTPQAAVVGGFKLSMPDVATVAINTAMLLEDAADAAITSVGLPTWARSPISVARKIFGLHNTPEERAFGVTEYLRQLRGEMGTNELREHLHLKFENYAQADAKIMALRALEVGFSSGTGNDLRSAYFAEIKPFYAQEAEREFTEKIVGRKN
jgi:hypothetical protein